MSNNNSAGAQIPSQSVIVPPITFATITDTPGFTLGSVLYDGSEFVYKGITNPGAAAFDCSYIAWGGNIMQLGDVGVSGGSSDPADGGLIEMDFAVTQSGNFRFLVGNGVPGIDNILTISGNGVFDKFGNRYMSKTLPTVALGGGAGTGATVSIVALSDNDFIVTYKCGTSSGVSTQFIVTFGTAFASAPVVSASPFGADHLPTFQNGAINIRSTTQIAWGFISGQTNTGVGQQIMFRLVG